jgi:hypothetical protein
MIADMAGGKSAGGAPKLSAWASRVPPRGRGRGCQTCKLHPDVVPEIAAFLKGKQTGEFGYTFAEFYEEFLVGECGYTLSYNAFNNHMMNCERDLYREVRTR